MLRSLRVRLTLLFVGLTIVPLIIAGTLITLQGFNSLQNQAVKSQSYLARQTAISLGDFFKERQNELFVLTQVYGLTSLDEKSQEDVLLTLLSKQPAYYEVALVNAEGQETIRLTRGEVVTPSALTSRATDPAFTAAMETNAVSLSPVHFSETARDRLITIAMPIEDLYTGQTGNVLIAEVRFQNVEESILRNLNLTSDQDVYVVDRTGVVIAHRNPSLVLKETTFKLPQKSGRTTGLQGDDVILAVETISLENLELTVVAEDSYDHATALAFDLRKLSILVTLVTLLVSGGVVTWVVYRAVKPIVKMARVAEAIQAGDLSAQADEKGSDEISALGRAFNKMTSQLRQTLTGLQDNITNLEKARLEREALIKDLQIAKRIADENSRLKSEFLSTMSHELRTPMNAIEGFTSIMLKRMGGAVYNEKTERYLTKVQANSARLLHLINDFLDLSRIESGRLEMADMPISPVEMVEKWKNDLSVLAEGKNITFETSVDPTLPNTIYGDEENLSKIATNLLGNAFKFTTEGSVTLKLERQDGQMAIQVTDTGIGIPPHAREFIFDEFRQVDQSSKRQYGGTGLGLAIVQKLTRAMGGTISVESEVGKGSTFTVLIPIRTERELA